MVQLTIGTGYADECAVDEDGVGHVLGGTHRVGIVEPDIAELVRAQRLVVRVSLCWVNL